MERTEAVKKLRELSKEKPNVINPSCTKLLVPTTSTKGGGGGELSQLPHDFRNSRLYNLQLWQAIRTIHERLKTGRVDDLSLVRFPWQLLYLRMFSTKLCLKQLKMTVFETFFQLCASPSPTF